MCVTISVTQDGVVENDMEIFQVHLQSKPKCGADCNCHIRFRRLHSESHHASHRSKDSPWSDSDSYAYLINKGDERIKLVIVIKGEPTTHETTLRTLQDMCYRYARHL